jgi:hypothetical protein
MIYYFISKNADFYGTFIPNFFYIKRSLKSDDEKKNPLLLS